MERSNYLDINERNGLIQCVVDVYEYVRDTCPSVANQEWNVDDWDALKVFFSAPATKAGFKQVFQAARAFIRSGCQTVSLSGVSVFMNPHFLKEKH